MKKLLFNINQQSIRRVDNLPVISDALNYFYIKVDFDVEWDGLIKHAVFKSLATGDTFDVILVSDECEIPPQITNVAGKFSVSVYGGDLYTTDSIYIEVLQSGYEVGEPPAPIEPTQNYVKTLSDESGVQLIKIVDEEVSFYDGTNWVVLYKAAELQRIANEGIRISQEEARELAEGLRVGAEINRESNEIARAVWEIYDNTKQYKKGNKVSYQGSSYIAHEEPPIGTIPTDISYYTMIASKGDKGDIGEVSLAQLKVVSDDLATHKEDYTTQRQQDQFKVAKVEKDINDYKSTMANVNVNQEAKQEVTGYGTISLPKNTANGQVSATRILGQSVTNVITNGNFANGTTGWNSSDSTLTASNNTLQATIVGATTYGIVSRTTNIPCVENKKIFIRAKARVTNPDCGTLLIKYFGSGGGAVAGTGTLRQSTPVQNQWYTFYGVVTLTSAFIGSFRINFVQEAYATSALGKSMEVQEAIAVDLNATYTDATTLTSEQCAQRLPVWFDGTKFTISASRLKSVGINEFDGELELGDIGTSNGILVPSTTRVRNKNHIKAETLKDYIFTNPVRLACYNNKKSFLGIAEYKNPYWTTLANTEYVKFASSTNDVNAEIMFNKGDILLPYEPYTESTQYLPNVGELRSLPNGTKDEVRVSGGKAEWVKRVSDTMEELAEPITTPIEVSGTLLSNPSGTVYVEKVVADAGIYDSGINVLHQDLPIDYVEKLSKVDFTTGLETELDISKVVINEDRKSFTHPDLVDGDIIFLTYFHSIEGTQGEMELEYYDSRHVLKDSVTDKFYKVVQTVADGILTDTLVEV